MKTRVRNDLFDARSGYVRGRSCFVFASWQLFKWLFFLTSFPWPSAWRVFILRVFGAKVGQGVYIKPRVNVHLPWKLMIGDFVWIGEEVYILNFEVVEVGEHACLSQRAFLCTGNHDFRDAAMGYRNRPIWVEAGAWVGAQVFVGPGVRIGRDAVITAGSVLFKEATAELLYAGNPASVIGRRWKD